jgi:hypothetical protein
MVETHWVCIVDTLFYTCFGSIRIYFWNTLLLKPSVVLRCMIHVAEYEWKQYMLWFGERVLTIFFLSKEAD